MKWLLLLLVLLGVPAATLILHEQLCRAGLNKVAEYEAPYPGDEFDKLKFAANNAPGKYIEAYRGPLGWRIKILKYAFIMGNYKLVSESVNRAIDMHKESPLEKDELMMQLAWMRAQAFDLTNEHWNEAAAAYRYYIDNWPESPLIDQAKSRATEIETIHR